MRALAVELVLWPAMKVQSQWLTIREDYCDGLGDCLQSCHAGAITFEEREEPVYD